MSVLVAAVELMHAQTQVTEVPQGAGWGELNSLLANKGMG